MARAYGANASLLAAFDSTYGSTPVDGYWQLPFVSTSLGSEQGLIANDLIGLGRHPSAPNRGVTRVEGDLGAPLARAEECLERYGICYLPGEAFHEGG
mgnify:CR=1 FL=1